MTKFKISTDEAKSLFSIKDKCINDDLDLPTYLSTFLNQINQWADGSKPENVGQVSELIKDFRASNPDGKLDDWVNYHENLKGETIQIPKGRKIVHMRDVKMKGIDQGVSDIIDKMLEIGISFFGFESDEQKNNAKKYIESKLKANIKKWLQNLTYNKTYCGLIAQELILTDIASRKKMTQILGSPFDEQKGIDGYIISENNYYPLQIKSSTFKIKNKREKFPCPIIEYSLLENDGIEYEFEDNKLIIPEGSDTWEKLKEELVKRLKE